MNHSWSIRQLPILPQEQTASSKPSFDPLCSLMIPPLKTHLEAILNKQQTPKKELFVAQLVVIFISCHVMFVGQQDIIMNLMIHPSSKKQLGLKICRLISTV